MTDEDWEAGFAKSLGVFLNGDAHPHARRRAASRSSTTASTSLFNAHHEPLDVHAARRALRQSVAAVTSTPPRSATARRTIPSKVCRPGDRSKCIRVRSW